MKLDAYVRFLSVLFINFSVLGFINHQGFDKYRNVLNFKYTAHSLMLKDRKSKMTGEVNLIGGFLKGIPRNLQNSRISVLMQNAQNSSSIKYFKFFGGSIYQLFLKDLVSNLYGSICLKLYHPNIKNRSSISCKLNGKDFSGIVDNVSFLSTTILSTSNATPNSTTIVTKTIIPNGHFIQAIISTI
jgi:hypothetical protein